jgi:hypothetical protein
MHDMLGCAQGGSVDLESLSLSDDNSTLKPDRISILPLQQRDGPWLPIASTVSHVSHSDHSGSYMQGQKHARSIVAQSVMIAGSHVMLSPWTGRCMQDGPIAI